MQLHPVLCRCKVLWSSKCNHKHKLVSRGAWWISSFRPGRWGVSCLFCLSHTCLTPTDLSSRRSEGQTLTYKDGNLQLLSLWDLIRRELVLMAPYSYKAAFSDSHQNHQVSFRLGVFPWYCCRNWMVPVYSGHCGKACQSISSMDRVLATWTAH